MSLAVTWSHAGSGATSTPAPARPRSTLRKVVHHLGQVLREGDTTLYLSGHAHHSRRTYPSWLIPYLNEDAWGGGLGRTLEMRNGGLASLAFTAFRNSLDEWEYNLGYMREWRLKQFGEHLTLRAGFTGLIISRSDYFYGAPFPAVLPQVSFGSGSTSVITMFVPRLPNELNMPDAIPGLNGDIVYTFARIKL